MHPPHQIREAQVANTRRQAEECVVLVHEMILQALPLRPYAGDRSPIAVFEGLKKGVHDTRSVSPDGRQIRQEFGSEIEQLVGRPRAPDRKPLQLRMYL